MNSKVSAFFGAAFVLLGIDQVTHGRYVWATVSFIVAVYYALRANKLWKIERS